jgi:hypothetical protein
MRRTLYQLPGFLTIIALILFACNMPGSSPTSAVAPTKESTAEVVPTGTATVTATETLTPEPSATATETLTPEPSATATPEAPMAKVVRKSNCRIGPGGLYELVATYEVEQMLEIVAKDLGGGYWFVQNPEKPEEQCYLLAQNIRISGETTALPKYTPLASPTAMPYFELTFKKLDTCEGVDFAVFTVKNVGSVPFRSAYIKVINQKTGKSVEQALNAFDLRVKCVLAKNIAPLDPGGTGYVASAPFKWSGRGEKLRAVIMVCTEKNLKGSCVTQSIDIKE